MNSSLEVMKKAPWDLLDHLQRLEARECRARLEARCQKGYPKIIHHGIKSSNILLDLNFEAKVADFGLAKLASDGFTHISTIPFLLTHHMEKTTDNDGLAT
ncbi:hypothetical protein SUGI_0777060 [Cryptomeria japonica]|nr:hypothetical protein SUGI_0777060 [Cryptomeria japonica]